MVNSSRKSDRQLKKRVFSFEAYDGDSSMDKTENSAQDRDYQDGGYISQIPSPASSNPYVGSQDGNQSPIRENIARNLHFFTECEAEDFLVEALLNIKSSIAISEEPMQVELLNGKSPRAKQSVKNTSSQQNVKYEYVSQTCEEHKKKHLRCPVNCKGRVLVKVARAISEDQHSIFDGEESFLDSFDMENADTENRFSITKKRSQSSLSDDSEANTSTVYAREQDQDEYLPYKAKKRQPVNLKKIVKKSPKKTNLNGDDEVGRKGKMSNVGRSMSADSFESKNAKTWDGEKLEDNEPLSEGAEEEIISRLSKKQKTQSEEELNELLDTQCRVSSTSVTVATSATDIANKSKRWIRFACEDHRKKHVKCPENCANRKAEFVFGSANGAD